jgi:hypothetical protein
MTGQHGQVLMVLFINHIGRIVGLMVQVEVMQLGSMHQEHGVAKHLGAEIIITH